MNFFDRRDAKRVKDLTGMGQILIDLKPKRCDSDVYLNQKFDVTELVKYIEKTFQPYIEEVSQHFEKFNAKAILQEYTQGINKKLPEYILVNEVGEAHTKEFFVEVKFNNMIIKT